MNITGNPYLDDDIWRMVHYMNMKEVLEEFNWKVKFYGNLFFYKYHCLHYKLPLLYTNLLNNVQSDIHYNETFDKYRDVMRQLKSIMNYFRRSNKWLQFINYVNKINITEGKGMKKTKRHPKKVNLF
jgi:hypothetical protein